MNAPLTDHQKKMILEYAEHDGHVTLTKDEIHSLFDELQSSRERLARISQNQHRKFLGREMILECIECGHRQQGWDNRDGIRCERCGGYANPKGWGKV